MTKTKHSKSVINSVRLPGAETLVLPDHASNKIVIHNASARKFTSDIYKYTRNWVDSTQDWDYWKTLVNATLNLRVP